MERGSSTAGTVLVIVLVLAAIGVFAPNVYGTIIDWLVGLPELATRIWQEVTG